MADVDDRQVQFVLQLLDERQDLFLARLVEGRQRLIHQQQPGIGEQGPAQGDALLLAAGERPGPALQQILDAEQTDHLIEADAAFGGGHPVEAVGQVVAHRQMGEQAAFLKDVAEAPFFRRQVDAFLRVEEGLAAQDDASALRAQQPRQDIHQRRLSGTRAPKKRSNSSRIAAELRFQ